MMRDPIQELVIPGVHGTPGTSRRSWRMASVALAVAIMWIVAWYWSTGAAMVAIWNRSETFAHGFLVAPIALWLIWRARGDFAHVAPRPSWWVLAPMGAAGIGWLLGELGAVNALSQFAFVALLVLAVPAVLGVSAARTIAFPLGFLLFAVPAGEFVMPQLMEWTADVTVRTIQLTGVPIYREGQTFVIPSGRWSVVEACSGIRYLIASVVIGTLYAYLTYRSLRRRLVFIGFSILVPIVANWVRAYMIVMLGHLSENTLAAGVDHLIYGWVFFGLVIIIMFWIGGRWREGEVPISAPAATTESAGSPREFLMGITVIAAAMMIWPSAYWAIKWNEARPAPVPLTLRAVGGWNATADELTDWQPRYQYPSTELHRSFRRGADAVGVYIGYYRNQNQKHKLVSSDNVMVRSGDPFWSRVASGAQPVSGINGSVNASTVELQNRAGNRLVAWHWYWIDGRLTGSAVLGKAYTAFSRLMGRGDDAAVVVVYAQKGRPGEAEATLAAFLREMGPGLLAELQRVRDDR